MSPVMGPTWTGPQPAALTSARSPGSCWEARAPQASTRAIAHLAPNGLPLTLQTAERYHLHRRALPKPPRLLLLAFHHPLLLGSPTRPM